MIVTARQLQALHRAGKPIVLPYHARLTPLARDLLRDLKIQPRFESVDESVITGLATIPQTTTPSLLWWAQGTCGGARAAMTMLEREMPLRAVAVLSDASSPLSVIEHLADEIASRRAAGGILLVSRAGETVVLGNKSPILRVAPAQSITDVDDAANSVQPNVLLLEHTRLSMHQIIQLTRRFAGCAKSPTPGTSRAIHSLTKFQSTPGGP